MALTFVTHGGKVLHETAIEQQAYYYYQDKKLYLLENGRLTQMAWREACLETQRLLEINDRLNATAYDSWGVCAQEVGDVLYLQLWNRLLKITDHRISPYRGYDVHGVPAICYKTRMMYTILLTLSSS